jgi:hypothetical protein
MTVSQTHDRIDLYNYETFTRSESAGKAGEFKNARRAGAKMAHKTWQEKLAFARECREQDGIENPMLVDDIQGTVHRVYGSMPNMVYIIDKNGKIVYQAMWTDPEEIASVLANLVLADRLQSQGVRVKPSYTERINYIPAEYAGGLREKVFDRAGPKAWTDYQNVFSGRDK